MLPWQRRHNQKQQAYQPHVARKQSAQQCNIRLDRVICGQKILFHEIKL